MNFLKIEGLTRVSVVCLEPTNGPSLLNMHGYSGLTPLHHPG